MYLRRSANLGERERRYTEGGGWDQECPRRLGGVEWDRAGWGGVPSPPFLLKVTRMVERPLSIEDGTRPQPRSLCPLPPFGLSVICVFFVFSLARLVQHTLGWPLQSGPMSKTYGGSFLYHQEPDLILVGLVVGLDYENPHLNP